VERRLLRLNGEAFLAEISALPVEFDGVTSVMVLARDINERKRWEIALQASVENAETAQKREREQAQLLERFYQHTHDCIVLLDRNFNFIRVNQAYADSCKRAVDEFPGHNHFDFYPSSLIEDFKQVVATGIAYRAFTRPFSFPDHPEWGETYWDLSLVPILNASGEIDLLLFTLKDVTARHRAELTLSKTNRELITISACDSLLVHASDEAELLNGMCRMIVEKNGYCMAWVGYAEQDEQKSVRPQSHAGDGDDFIAKAQFSWGDNQYGRGPTGTAIRTGKTIVVHNIKTTECRPWCDHALACGFTSSIALPLHDGKNIFGVLSIYSNELNVFEDEEIRLLEQLADDLSFGICGLRSGLARKQAEEKVIAYVQQLEESMQGTLQAVSNMVEQRDPYTAGHERRVGIIAADIAREMGWPEEKCNILKLIGLVHDLGKISTPAEILSKPGRLTALEYEMVKCHVEKGYEILKDVKFPLPIAEIIRQHHEHMDGSGYPQGLKGQDILPEARIIAVSDVLESMASHRPYRPALGVESALKEIVDHRDTFYDGNVVDALLKLVREKGYQLPS
jgi:putative nucleotidyltransferase with HDIG domain/PAS domain S-box-containing protein